MFDPAKIFLTSVFDILNYDKSSYNFDELLKQLSEKNECEALNCKVDIASINRQIQMQNFFIQNILIKKTNIFFKKMNFANEKAKLFFEDITIDIFHKKILDKNDDVKLIQEEKIEKKEEKKSGGGGFLNNVVNVVVHNLVISLKNIKIKIYDKENKNVDYVLLIKNINFKEAKDVKPLEAKEKGKFLFIHNKAVYIEGILFKEKFEENDDLFFEEKNENIIKNENCLLYMKNEIEFDIFHDNEKSILTISNLTTKFFLENILNIKQINSLYNYFIAKEKKDEEKKEIIKKVLLVNNKEKINNNDNGIEFMGFKIKKINFEIKIDLVYLILFEGKNNEKIKEKKFISLEENGDKINTENNIIEHFNIYQDNYYIFYLNNLIKKNKSFIIDNLSLDLIIPENIKKENENNNIINNDINNNIINYIQITKLNLNSEKKEITYDNIYFELNDYFISLINLFSNNSEKIKYVYVAENNINKVPEEKKEENNNIISTAEKKEINNENKILIEEEKNTPIINGKNLNIKIFLNKNINDTIESISLNDIFKPPEKNNYINFELNNLNFNKDNITYDKAELTYNDIELKIVYYIIKLLDKQNSSRIENGVNNEKNFYFNYELYIFINPKIIKQIFDYAQKISNIFNKNKNEYVYDNIPIDYNNNYYIHQESNISINFGININSIKIILTENIENNEKIINTDKNENINLPINEIIYNEDNNYLSFNLNEISFKYNLNNSKEKIGLIIKSFIIKDNIVNSKYKILLSNYEFKKQNEIFMNIELNIIFNQDLKKFEISPKIIIAPLALYIDQITICYLYNIFNQMKLNEEKNKNENDIIEKNNNMDIIIETNEEELKINNNEGNYILSDIEIQKFFIELTYNTNDAIKNAEIMNNRIGSLLNKTSINNLKIIFQKFTTEENTKLNPKDCLKKIYEFYSSDMIKQISGSFVSALPLFNHIYNSIDGLLDIVRQPYEKYTNNQSLADGLVQGVGSWVVKTATMFTYLGESIGNVFSFKSCGCKGNEDNNYSTCRNFRHLINENNKEKEEYYLK